MKTYRDYTGTLPQGVEVEQEGALTRIFFNFEQAAAPAGEDGQAEESVQQLVCDNVDVEQLTYPAIVSAIVRDSYTEDEREAILANYENAKDTDSDITEEKRAEYIAEYQEYQQCRAKAKEIARQVMSL